MLKRIFAAVLAAAVIFVAAVRLPLPDRRAADRAEETPPAALSRLFREADHIILCTCVSAEGADTETPTSRFRAEEFLEGEDKILYLFYLPVAAVKAKRFLVYLEDTVKEDGSSGIKLMTDAPLPVENGRVEFEDSVCSVESIRRDIERQRKILTVPAQSFYYSGLEGLARACDEIVIGRVLTVGEPTVTPCRSVEKGEVTLFNQEQVFADIKVENGFYGSMRYGDRISVVVSPYDARPVINANDLSPRVFDSLPAASPKAGNVYLFFLIKSEDEKSLYYFTVNPYEGFVRVIGNNVVSPYYNEALSDIGDLRVFAEKLRAILNDE